MDAIETASQNTETYSGYAENLIEIDNCKRYLFVRFVRRMNVIFI